MSELISKETLICEIVNTQTNSDGYNSAYQTYTTAYHSGSATRQLEILDIVKKIPTISEQEIRDNAIDKFAEAIKATLPIAVHRDCSEVDYEVDYALYSLRHRIDRIAEQLKGEAI